MTTKRKLLDRIALAASGAALAGLLVLASPGVSIGQAQGAITPNYKGVVPVIWRLEVANALQSALRRGRVDAAFRDATLRDLGQLDIVNDPDTSSHAWAETLQLADRFRLTLYDAAYMELAQRRHLPLATLDRELRMAAKALGTVLLGTAQ